MNENAIVLKMELVFLLGYLNGSLETGCTAGEIAYLKKRVEAVLLSKPE